MATDSPVSTTTASKKRGSSLGLTERLVDDPEGAAAKHAFGVVGVALLHLVTTLGGLHLHVRERMLDLTRH